LTIDVTVPVPVETKSVRIPVELEALELVTGARSVIDVDMGASTHSFRSS
jgi:hypothetical protein